MARAAAWIIGVTFTLAAANGVGDAALRDGVVWMAVSRGASMPGLVQARFVAVAREIAAWVAIPSGVAALAAVASAGSVESALRRAALLVVAGAFAAMTGILLGAIAVASDALRPRGGRPVLFAIVFLPWLVAGLVDLPHASIPGALEAFLETALGAVGLGRFA